MAALLIVRFEAGRHRVEGLRDGTEGLGPVLGNARREIAVGQPVRSFDDPAERNAEATDHGVQERENYQARHHGDCEWRRRAA